MTKALLPCLLLAASATLPLAAQVSRSPLQEHRSSLGLEFVAVVGSAALIARHEVTVGQWRQFLEQSHYDWSFQPHFEQQDNHPAVGISLQDARAFCNWLTRFEQDNGKLRAGQLYRLPTREEWDAAAALNRSRKPDLNLTDVAEDEKTHPWGMAWPPPTGAGNFEASGIKGYQDAHRFTAPVGSYSANSNGLHDLAGNVWEWCWDPEIRAQQQGHLRGGSWAYFRQECLRSDYSMSAPAELRAATVGLRCVFEDPVRTASMLANLEANRERIRASLRREMLGAEVNPDDVAAMRRKLATRLSPAGSTPSAPMAQATAKTTNPARAGVEFINSLGARFLPLGDKLLVAQRETSVAEILQWLKASGGQWPQRPSFLTQDTHAAVGLSWIEAQSFCQWLSRLESDLGHLPRGASYRLPTDLEWSRLVQLPQEGGADPAARSGAVADHFPWALHRQFPPLGQGVNLDAGRLPGFNDGHAYTAPVDSEQANSLGLQGLGGNAAEWCSDTWPDRPEERVVRGGSWLGWQRDALLSSVRRHAKAAEGHADIGIRLVLDLASAAAAAP